MLGCPANSYIDFQIKDHAYHITDIDGQRDQLQKESHTGITRPRYGLEINIAGHNENIGRTQDEQRRYRCRH